MKYLHAQKGIGKLFAAQLLQLIATILLAVTALLFAVFAVLAEGGMTAGLGAAGIGLAGGAVGVVVIFIVSVVLTVVGMIQTSKDVRAFKAAIWTYLISIAAAMFLLVLSVLYSDSQVEANDLIQVTADIVNAIVTILILQGICGIAEELRNEKVFRRGQTLFHIIIWIALISIMLKALGFFLTNVFTQTIDTVMTAVTLALSIVKYFVYLSFLRQASKMLKEHAANQ